MTKTYLDMSMSLDGFVTDPDASSQTPSEDPGRLHDWMFARQTPADTEMVAERYARTGAVVIGRCMFDVGFKPWGDPPPFRGLPVFIVTHDPKPAIPMKGGTVYTFVNGIDAALTRAKEAAGERDVGVWGGADLAMQYLDAGLLDEMELHLAPIALGGGKRLFDRKRPSPIELTCTRTISTPAATHLRFRFTRA
jgi:dihydrofolate reductase